MAFDRKRFLGLTVIDFSSSVGWNQDGSSLVIKMAPEDGESLSGYTLGDVYDFEMGAFKFTGFLERVLERHDSGGNVFEARLTDGKEIIANVQCVTNNFYGVTTDDDCLVANYFNIFRHFERNAYGDANANESGLDVKKFVQGVNELSKKCGIISANKKFTIDISNLLKDLPDYYRISGPTIGLMEAISQICDDIGVLWRVELEGTNFIIKTTSLAVDQANQQVFDSIKLKAKDKNVIAWDAGTEAANNVTSNFVIWGGAKENSHQFNKTSLSDAVVKYFWGYDINGNPYHSTNYYVRTLTNLIGQTFPLEVMDIMLPAVGIEDIWTRNGSYQTSSLELMCVMGSQSAWELYLELYDREKYEAIFLRGARNWDADKLAWMAYGGAGQFPIERNFLDKENDIGIRRAARLYSYLKSICENYWGKQFLVQVNSGPASNLKGVGNYLLGDGATEKTGGLTVRNKLERKLPKDALVDPPEGTYNIVPSNSGWSDPKYPNNYVPKPIWDGTFKDAQGKLQNWFIFQAQNNWFQIDDSSPDCYVANQGSFSYIYIKANASERYVKVDGTEHVHVSLPQAPFLIGPEEARSELGYDALSRFLFGLFGPLLIGQSDLFKVGYAPVTPWNVLLSFRSTTNDFYGPWYKDSKKGGQTKIEHDSTLTPWSVSSGANLAQVFELKLKDITPIDKFETGSITKVSLPEMKLGDELQSGGAVVTSINASYGTNGVTTQYAFRTFTPRFGIPSRFIVERMKKQAIRQNEDRRNILKAYMDTIARQQAAYRAEMGSKIRSIFLDFLGRRHDRMSPHANILMGMGFANSGPGAARGSGKFSRSKILGATYKQTENVKDLGKKLYEFISEDTKSCASIDTIFCPFYNGIGSPSGLPSLGYIQATNVRSQSFTNFLDPAYMEKDKFIDARRGKIPTSQTYNPFKLFCHFDTLLKPNRDRWDNHNQPLEYDMTSTGIGAQVLKANVIALRGPLMVAGWGVDLWTGYITPYSDYGMTNAYASSGSKVKATAPWEGAQSKVTGPVDLMWDSARGVWTSHDVARVRPAGKIGQTVQNSLGRLTTGSAYLYTNMQPDGGGTVQVYNLSTKPQYGGIDTLAYFSVFDNRWYIKGEGCHARYWDNELLSTLAKINKWTQNPNNPKSSLPYYIDFYVQKGVYDPLVGVNQFKEVVPEHACVDLIQTSGMSSPVGIPRGSITCPDGAVINVYDYLWFFHGLAKELIPWEDENWCDGHDGTTTQDPSTTTENPCQDYVTDVYCNADGTITVTKSSICGGSGQSAGPSPTPTYQSKDAEYYILRAKVKKLEGMIEKLMKHLNISNFEEVL